MMVICIASGKGGTGKTSVVAHFKIPTLACINKFDLNEAMSHRITDFCTRHRIDLVGRISYDTSVTRAMVAGQSIVEFSDGGVSETIRQVWHRVEDFLTDKA